MSTTPALAAGHRCMTLNAAGRSPDDRDARVVPERPGCWARYRIPRTVHG